MQVNKNVIIATGVVAAAVGVYALAKCGAKWIRSKKQTKQEVAVQPDTAIDDVKTDINESDDFKVAFLAKFDSVTDTFNIELKHHYGTSYLVGLACDTQAVIGNTYKFTLKDSRKGLMFTGKEGNAVVFQRYSDRDNLFCYHTVSGGNCNTKIVDGSMREAIKQAFNMEGDVNEFLTRK